MSSEDASEGGRPQLSRPLHRFAQSLVVLTFCLITLGGLVTSHDAGLSVPDWPTTYGHNMFTFPLSGMVGGIFYEHGHRLLASGVGFLTIILAVWLTISESRRWMKVLGWTALAAVIVQGILGGLTVLYFLPAPISVSHAGLALIFFCMTITIAFAASPRWAKRFPNPGAGRDPLFRFAVVMTGILFIQILLGAGMRHTWDREIGLAVVGFPLSNGQWIPEFTDGVVVLHFIHRWFAFLVAGVIFAFGSRVASRGGEALHLAVPTGILAMLTLAQMGLGILTVLTERLPVMTTLHQANGALLFGAAYLIVLRSYATGRGGEAVAKDRKEGRSGEYALQN